MGFFIYDHIISHAILSQLVQSGPVLQRSQHWPFQPKLIAGTPVPIRTGKNLFMSSNFSYQRDRDKMSGHSDISWGIFFFYTSSLSLSIQQTFISSLLLSLAFPFCCQSNMYICASQVVNLTLPLNFRHTGDLPQYVWVKCIVHSFAGNSCIFYKHVY